ncbi:hypothetical protein OUZ56_024101 [Daphnia magna]|uniref:Uncharacterized protein n=1 Tax=Daphnia magna TaxID=35525 RepID=A0ABR0B058_9CRUS|nr:hypothetical protein OUZ56_024101 [Daphnia magna]
MPHEVIEINIVDIETAPEGFQPDEIETFSICEEYAQNSAAPDDEGDDWLHDMSSTCSTATGLLYVLLPLRPQAM